ncbi:hypothetical protein [Marinobacterium arenosum]|uniref:hypothetical protein n=1 Tax=Marinobacterium arenosum TaxID=2862496 RepID=UPI001C94EB91|nr:hypothetical protein [Marinobacterium arenosum]MBY4678905.1 hypothetical protein [Marinobacterium arenosum]
MIIHPDSSEDAAFAGGRNIAMKVPAHQWRQTVQFYRDLVGLKVIEPESADGTSVCFEFGANRLWIDRVAALSQAEIWLELTTGDLTRAVNRCECGGVVRRDEIEPLPEQVRGFWIENPASIIHLVCEKGSE